MIQALCVFVAQAVYVFLLGFQSRNVRDNQFAMAALTSFCLGICGLTCMGVVVLAVQSRDPLPLVAYVLAGPVGICSAMAIHNRVASQGTPKPPEKQQAKFKPVGHINDELTTHAISYGLPHWYCISQRSNKWWVRADGYELSFDFDCEFETWPEMLRDFDTRYPLESV